MTATQEIGIYSHKPLSIRDCHLELIGVNFLVMFYKADKDMIERKDLSDSEKMLVMVLQGLSERQGYCFATNAKLAAMVGWSVDKLRNNLRTLGEKGIVAYTLEDGNRRKLTLPQGGVQFHTEGGVQNDTGGCEDLHRGVYENTQGGVQNDTPLHNRTIKRTDNTTIKREAPAYAAVMPWKTNSFSEIWQIWCKFRTTELRKPKYKEMGEQAALKKLSELAGGDEATAHKIIEQSIANAWQGLFELKTNKPQYNGQQPAVTDQLKRNLANSILNGDFKYD